MHTFEKQGGKNEERGPKFREALHLKKVVKEMEEARGNSQKPVEKNKTPHFPNLAYQI